MMISVRQRGSVWWLEGRIGPRRKRVQISLGTRNHSFAIEMVRKVEHAMADGDSPIWLELARMLPPLTFQRLRVVGGWPVEGPTLPTWNDLATKFRAEMDRRILLSKFRESTKTRYKRTVDDFGEFLTIRDIFKLEDINRGVIEDFKVWKLEQTKKRKQSRPGGRGIVLDAAILHRVFAYAAECELITRNPVKLEGRPGDSPEGGAQPFKPKELVKLREHAGGDLLAFLLLRYTGLRGSDAVLLTWQEIDWEAREISRLTLKRNKRVVLPIHTELFFALENEKLRRDPKPLDRVLLNPATGQPLTRPRLYERFVALGERADVAHVHPHRFRDTLAVDMLVRGASPYDVAKILGDTVDTVERHYAPFVPALRERVRRLMENGEGLEKLAVTNRGQSPPRERQPN